MSSSCYYPNDSRANVLHPAPVTGSSLGLEDLEPKEEVLPPGDTAVGQLDGKWDCFLVSLDSSCQWTSKKGSFCAGWVIDSKCEREIGLLLHDGGKGSMSASQSIQATIIKYHRLSGLQTTEIYFSWSWRLGRLWSIYQQIQYLVRACFLIHGWPSSHCVFTWQKEQESSLGCLL